MQGLPLLLLKAKIILVGIWPLISWTVPVLSVCATWWLVNQTDRVVAWLFPHAEWEKSLGWLNIRAERRARTALRWVGYFIYLLLAAMLLGIVWGAKGLQAIDNPWDPWEMSDVFLRGSVLIFCLGAWLFYFGAWLMPRLRAEREWRELQKFRAEMEEYEREQQEREAPSRFAGLPPKPRTDLPLIPDRGRRKRS